MNAVHEHCSSQIFFEFLFIKLNKNKIKKSNKMRQNFGKIKIFEKQKTKNVDKYILNA